MPTEENSGHASGSTDGRSPAEASKPRKRRRWPRRLAIAVVVLFCLLVALVALAPFLASTRAVTHVLLATANDKVKGTIDVGSVSLSWGGPLEVRDFRVLDPEDREVLKVSKLSCTVGLWGLLTAYEDFGEVSIDAPQVNLNLTDDNEITLAQAFQVELSSSSDASEGGALPEPHGRIIVRDGVVRISRNDRSPFEIADLDGEVELKSLADVAGKLAVTLADGGQLAAEVAIRDLVSGGEISIDGVSGSAKVHTDGDIDVAPLAAVFAPDTGLAAKANIDIDATLTDGNVQAEFATGVRGLQTAERAGTHAAPIDLSLTGQFNMTPEQITAKANLAGAAGNASADIAYQLSDKPIEIAIDDVLAAVLTGESIELPDFSAKAQANVDLAALEQALPGLLHIRPGQQITGGKLEIASFSASGGSQPRASGAVALKDVTVASGERTARLEPVSLDFDAHLESGKGLEIGRAELKSSFAEVVASGAASDLRATFNGDLTTLKRELGQVFELDSFEMGGKLAGAIELKRADDQHVGVTAEVTADQVQYAADERRFDLPRASVNLAGDLTLMNGKAEKFTASAVKADLNGEVLASATGWYDLQQNAFQADLGVERAELGFLASRAAALGIDEMSRYGGTLRLQAAVAKGVGQKAIRSNGRIVAQNLSADGQALLEGDTSVTWAGAQLAADAGDVQVERVQLESTAATLDASGVRWQSGDSLVLRGDVNGAADLARCLKAVGLVARMEEPPEIAGRLNVNAKCAADGPVVGMVAKGGIDGLTIGSGEQAITQQQLQFDADAKLDQQHERITLTAAKLTSKMLSAEITGTIDEYKSRNILRLSGSYDASWRELTALLHELAPATADTIIVTGNSRSSSSRSPARRIVRSSSRRTAR